MTSGHDPSLSIYLPITYAGGTGRQGESLVVGPFVIRVSVPCAARDLGEPRDHRTLPLRERQRPKGPFGFPLYQPEIFSLVKNSINARLNSSAHSS